MSKSEVPTEAQNEASLHNFKIKRLAGILAHAKALLPPEDYEFIEVGVMPTLNHLREENARKALIKTGYRTTGKPRKRIWVK